jgi:AbrB family looped-hinge helix DNA binding protein
VKLALVEIVTVTSKGQVTIPSRLRRELRIVKGEKLLIVREGNVVKMIPVPKLSNLAGIDKEVFKGRKPSEEIEAMRKEWTEEFEKRVQQA